ncbi:hypothetical protein LSAT2_024871, partial [Lamellibrachia satsuma]
RSHSMMTEEVWEWQHPGENSSTASRPLKSRTDCTSSMSMNRVYEPTGYPHGNCKLHNTADSSVEGQDHQSRVPQQLSTTTTTSTPHLVAPYVYLVAPHIYLAAPHIYMVAPHIYLAAPHIYMVAPHIYLAAPRIYLAAPRIYLAAPHIYMTWLCSDTDSSRISEMMPTGYAFEHVPCNIGHSGGGITVLFKA